ncbi:hypothetical protein MSI_15110 [Treponema sp. JC4]|uniref:DUF1302 family protein n=1 Tax=Treponema sp. JC4 TaxID=1124982 RepID=UPI00025B0737|nr:DUF1302 family protein [Treponema sp. JC4]EID85024.1 hypothetical protein MSI_15110 [Treponema sp. JC4]
MKRSVLNMIAAGLFALSLPAFAQEIEFTGSLTTQAGIGLPNTDDNKGDFLTGQTVFDGTMKSYLGESMAYVNGQVIFDAIGSQSTNGYSAFASDNGNFALHLKEAYLDWRGEMFALRVGRQIAAWGKADGIQVADVLCPKDDSKMIASTYKDSRLGIDAVRLSLLTDKAQFDAYWIPIFTPSLLPLAKNNPLRKCILPDSYDGVPVNGPQKYDDFDLPKKAIYNGEYALRASTYLSALDLSFYAFYGWDDNPFMAYSIDNSGITVGGEYKRMAMLGADAAIPAGDFVFRFEAAYFPQRSIQTDSKKQATGEILDAGKKAHQVIALAGFDWTPSGGWTITAQYFADLICDYKDDLERKLYQHQMTLSLEKSFINETLTLSATGALDLNELSSTAEVECAYSFSDAITLSAIVDLFLKGIDGKEGQYGAYESLSCGTLKAKISF